MVLARVESIWSRLMMTEESEGNSKASFLAFLVSHLVIPPRMDPEKQPIDSKESNLQPIPRPCRSSNKLRRIGIPLVLISLSLVSLYYKPTFPTFTFEPTRSDWNPSLGGYWRQFAASTRLDPERGTLRVPLSHSHSKQDLLDEFLTVPSAESAREVSKS